MKFKTNERGFVLAEFAIALPLLIILLYSLGLVTLSGLKIAREQAADYALETEAQYVIDRITIDARAAESVKVAKNERFDKIIFICHANKSLSDKEFYDIYMQRIYVVHAKGDAAPEDKIYHVYTQREENDDSDPSVQKKKGNSFSSPLTGANTYGDTNVIEFKVDETKLAQKILHFTLEMESVVTKHKVKFATAVYMPSYQD